MIDSPLYWWIAIILLVASEIYAAIKAWRKGKWKRLKYNIKQSCNNYIGIANMALVLYLMMIALIPLGYITDWATNHAELASEISGQLVYRFIPLAYVVLIILVSLRLIYHGLIPRLKLNDEEKQWDKKSGDKLKNKIKEWLHIPNKKKEIDVK